MPELGINNNPILPAANEDLSEESEIPLKFFTGTTTVKRVPKASRFQAAAALTDAIQGVLAALDERKA